MTYFEVQSHNLPGGPDDNTMNLRIYAASTKPRTTDLPYRNQKLYR
jgi:hypothetical protein